MNANLILILICLGLGVMLKKSGRLPLDAAKAFNAFVIWISLPAVVLLQIPKLLNHMVWSWDVLIPISMPWLLFGLSFTFFNLWGRYRGWSTAVTGALVMTAGLGNTSFVGFPLLEALIGPQAIPTALIVDQAGTFLALSSVGLLFCSLNSPISKGQKVGLAQVTKRILGFPPFVTVLVTLVLWLIGYSLPQNLNEALEKLAGTLVPLALVAVGFQLKFAYSPLRSRAEPVAIGLFFKLIAAPLIFWSLYVKILGSTSLSSKITVLESAMASMITAGVVAEEFGFDPEVVNLMIGLGIPLSLGSVVIWHAYLG